jgi:DNA-binding transcriptional regulator LsrR (DeoR family)
VNPGENSVELVRQTSARSGGACYSIYAPQVLPDASTAKLLSQQREVSEAGACAEVCAVLMDADGNQVAEEFHRALHLGRQCPATGDPGRHRRRRGAAKALVMKSIIAGGYANTVVVDTSLATAMLS